MLPAVAAHLSAIENWTNEQPEENPSDYRLVKVDINFLNPATYRDGIELLKHESKMCNSVEVHCFSDFEKLRRFSFLKNGFEYCQLKKGSSLFLKIEQYAQTRRENPGRNFLTDRIELPVICELKQFMASWLKERNIPGTPVIPHAGFTYRDSDRSAYATPPFHFVHVDYSKKRLIDTSLALEALKYKHAVEDEFDVTLSSDEYRQLIDRESTIWLNVWIPLQEKESNNGLVLMDTNSVLNLDQKLQPISFQGMITYSLFPSSEQKWITLDNLTLNKRVVAIFNTINTPHTAGLIPSEEGTPLKGPRTSVEFRVMVLIPPTKP